MELRLPEQLKSGQKLTFRIQYQYRFPVNYKMPISGEQNRSVGHKKIGNIYAVAQWYPRMYVLDDVEGWNTLPYLGNGEFLSRLW